MRQRLYFLINGILTNPASRSDWNYRGVAWIEQNTSFQALQFQYFTTALFHNWTQADRVHQCMEMLKGFKSSDIYLVGHSNGCDVISRILKYSDLRVREAHLFAGAVEEDCDKNGLNDALANNRLDQAYCYCSRNDSALLAAKRTNWFTKIVGANFGLLGLNGPKDSDFTQRLQTIWRNDLDHCAWWSIKNFEGSMRYIVGAQQP